MAINRYMADDILLAEILRRLNELKKRAGLSDVEIAAELQGKVSRKIYQQKVNDVLSGEKKKPELDLLAAMTRALGSSLAKEIQNAEQQTRGAAPDDDWDWLMFGRRLGVERRASVRAAIEGRAGESADTGVTPRATRQKRPGGRE